MEWVQRPGHQHGAGLPASDPDAANLPQYLRRELRQRLPQAIKELEHANIAPVDVAQAAIGPGMAIFSQAKAVLNPMTPR